MNQTKCSLIWRGTAKFAAICGMMVLCSHQSAGAEPKLTSKGSPGSLANTTAVAVSPGQALKSLQAPAPVEDGDLEANDEISRGPAATVYPKVAPSVVFIATAGGSGTGFVVDSEGWIVTNHHVVDGAPLAIPGGFRLVNVYTGHIDNGLMTLDPKPIQGVVMVTNQVKDLALIKLVEVPEGRKLVPIPLAEKGALPGTDCIAIGHPKRGMLWTVRSGEVAGVGTWPTDQLNTIMRSLTLAGDDREKFKQSLTAAGTRKVLISTCGINPGDSGGPLVNDKGELIAVTFAIPKGDSGDAGISLDKFSYHVHLDDVRKFIEQPRPQSPELYIPDIWAPSTSSAIVDDDKNGKLDTWYFIMDKEKPPTGYLLDVDEDSPADIIDRVNKDFSSRGQFDVEFVSQSYPLSRAFYDRNNDGKIDAILTDADRDGISDISLRLDAEGWISITAKDLGMISPGLFEDEALRKRFVEHMQAGNPEEQEPAEQKPATGDESDKAAEPAPAA